jgi:hypothetical protein
MCCAVADCGRPECPVCYWGRISVRTSASTQEPMRADAKADFKEKKKANPDMPKKRHREGPHR